LNQWAIENVNCRTDVGRIVHTPGGLRKRGSLIKNIKKKNIKKRKGKGSYSNIEWQNRGSPLQSQRRNRKAASLQIRRKSVLAATAFNKEYCCSEISRDSESEFIKRRLRGSDGGPRTTGGERSPQCELFLPCS